MMTTDEYDSPALRPIEAISLQKVSRRVQFTRDILKSTAIVFESKMLWLLVFGPIALIGDSTGYLGEAACFACSGIALIPCAERLSFVTEQVAAHTNGTIGALLNATFGNAPELLISTAALRLGFYRVVQLTMLGSMLTNLLFVFGMASFIGGIRWQVQELRITSGNVSVGMLLAATAGSLLPAALYYSGQLKMNQPAANQGDNNGGSYIPSQGELHFSRVNAVILMILYIAYLIFQLGTHKDEFAEQDNVVETNRLIFESHFRASHVKRKKSLRNKCCLRFLSNMSALETTTIEMEPLYGIVKNALTTDQSSLSSGSSGASTITFDLEQPHSKQHRSHDIVGNIPSSPIPYLRSDSQSLPGKSGAHRRNRESKKRQSPDYVNSMTSNALELPNDEDILGPSAFSQKRKNSVVKQATSSEIDSSNGQMALWTGILWLFIITLCISAMSDILVDTIDGFANRCHISEVFTSMVILPFFSNIAEQVSAVIFAYHNKMDLCVGVTVGSAIQIAMFVLPGCVLIGSAMDRSMTLFFRGFETCCLFLGVICVAAVLQGGTTNWLVGMTLVGIYIMIATGIWFHELEDLSIDLELAIQNKTSAL